MRFTLTVDGKKIEVDGNFATEDSINRLAKAIQSDLSGASKDLNDLGKKTKSANKNINDLGDVSEDAASGINDVINANKKSNKVAEKLQKSFDVAREALGDFQYSMRGVSSESMDFGGIVDSAGGALSGLVRLIPGVGTVASGIITAGTGLTSFAIGMVESLRDLNSGFLNLGLGIEGGLDGLVDAADVAGLGVNQFGNALMKSSNSLRLFESGTSSAVKNIGQAYNLMGSDVRRQLFAMGYTTDDIISGMADYGAQMGLLGRELTPDELRDGTVRYLKNLNELSKLTGKSVEEQKAAQEALQLDAAFQSFLKTLDPKVAEQFSAQIAALPPEMQKLAMAEALGVQLVADKNAAYMQANAPKLMSSLGEGIDAVLAGLSPEEIQEKFVKAAVVGAEELIAMRDSFGPQTLFYMGQVGGVAGDLADKLQLLILEAEKFGKATQKSEKSTSGLARFLGSMTEATNNVLSLFQSSFFDVVQTLDGPFTWLADAVSGSAKWLDELKTSLKSWFNAEEEPEKAAEAKEEMDGLLGRFFKTLEDIWTGLWESIYNFIFDPIYDAITAALPSWLGGTGLTREEREQAQKDANVDQLSQVMRLRNKNQELRQDFENAPSESEAWLWQTSQADIDRNIQENNQALQQLYDSLKQQVGEEKFKEIIDQLGERDSDIAANLARRHSRIQRRQLEEMSREILGYDRGGMIKPNEIGIVGEIGPEIVQGPVNVTGRIDTKNIIESLAIDKQSSEQNNDATNQQIGSLVSTVESGNEVNKKMLQELQILGQRLVEQTSRIDQLVLASEESNRINRSMSFSRA